MNKTPNAEELRALMNATDDVPPYLVVAAGFYWLVEQGARFWVNGYQIVFSLPSVCRKCAQSMPFEDWKTDYYIDIIYPNIV